MATFTSTASAQTQKDRSTSRSASRSHRTRTEKSAHLEAHARQRTASAHSAAQSYPERDELTVKLLPLVKRVAFEMRERLPQHVEVEDLAGAGVLGLLHAVRKFDARKHVKIETYARHRIRGAILDSLREMDTASRDMRRKNKNAEKIYQRLQSELGRPVSDEEMARALGVSLKKWYRTVQELNSLGVEWMRPTQMPEVNVVDEKNLPADDRENPFDLCYRGEQREILGRVTASLPERERTVIELYYQREMTMKQIGDRMGIDESRVSQIHSGALIHLRNRVKKVLRPVASNVPPAFMVARPQGPRPAWIF